MRKEMIFRMQTTTESERSRAMKAAASIKGVESVTLAGEEKNLLLIIGVGLGLSHINTLSKKVGHAELIELRTSGFLSTVHATHDELRTELNNLERIISRAEEPRNLKLSLLRYITKNFSDELRIGHGGCGVVYKGVLPSGIMVAVKKLFDNHTIDDNMFHQEVTSTMTITHKNIVRCLGYCSHTEEKAVKIEGKIVLAQIRERLLCFEHIGNGSVENHLTDELRGLEWHTRYQIIKGCCEGLYHLHNENHIIHMDLKRANILLDDQMVPKITDFGLSRLDDKSRTMSTDRLISLGYCSPEYLHHGKMSAKSDIYSLGVVILELVTGSKEMPSISTVLRRWKHRWNKSAKDTHLGCKQVFKCLNLVQRCIARDPADRPNIWDIMGDLNKMDTTDEDISDDPECPEVEDMLRIEPLDILLPMELKKPIIYSLQLTNGTDDHFAFWISTTSLRPYNIDPIKDIVPPLSTRSVTITLQGLEKAPLHNQCKDKFNVKSTKVDCSLTAKDISEQLFDRVLNVVDKVNLTIVLDIPNGQPVMVHTRDQHDYHRMHTWRDIYADHISG